MSNKQSSCVLLDKTLVFIWRSILKLGLVPLRIPSGWMVAYNNFLEISPYDFVDDTFKYAMELDEDILQM